jgi:hypothetical protein
MVLSPLAVMKTMGSSAPMSQFLLKVRTRHSGHRNVEQQTVRVADGIGREERLGG